ncbi:MAG: TetR/AcrR family transcriptional regulator [Parvularcula sp.]
MPERTRRPAPDDLRRKARQTARTLLAEGGPENVKARAVAKAVGVSIGTIYNLFGDLDDLLFEVNGEIYDELLTAITSSKDPAPDTPNAMQVRLRSLGHAYLEFVAAHADLWAGVLAFNRQRKKSVPEWYRDKERELFNVLKEKLGPEGQMAHIPQADLAPQALWAAVHGIISVSIGRDGLLATRQEIADQIDLVVTAVVTMLEREA